MKLGTTLLLLTGTFVLLLSLILLNRKALDADEISWGFNAFSILKTGRDEHGNFLPLTIKAYGDFRAPLYVYLLIPLLLIFNFSDFAIRLPAIFCAFFTLVIATIFCRRLFKSKVLTIFFTWQLLFSVWFTQYAFSAIETNVAMFFVTLGILFLQQKSAKANFYWVAAVSFALSLYSYQSERVLVPLFIALFLFSKKDAFREKAERRRYGKFLGIFFVLLLPLLFQIISEPRALVGRASSLSLANSLPLRQRLWQDQTTDQSIALTRLLHNKLTYNLSSFVDNYAKILSFNTLFLKADESIPFLDPKTALFPKLLSPFFYLGLFYLLKKKVHHFLWLWFFLPPVISAVTWQIPGLSRSINLVIPFYLITTFGFSQLKENLSQKWPLRNFGFKFFWILTAFLSLEYFVNFQNLRNFYQEFAGSKRVLGFENIAQSLEKIDKNYEQIHISAKSGDHPYIFPAFYQRWDPNWFWKNKIFCQSDSDANYLEVCQVGKYQFPKKLIFNATGEESAILFVGFSEELGKNAKIIQRVKVADKQRTIFVFTQSDQ